MADLSAPWRQFLDAVASGGKPSREDLDETIQDCLRGELGDTGSRERLLRAKLIQATEQIGALVAEGSSGTAREIARQYAEELDGRMPEHRPSRRPGSVREVVESIPRGVG